MQKNDYADLEIRIHGKLKGAYEVEFTCEGREFPVGRLLASKQPKNPDGEALFDWLNSDENLKLAWAEIQGSHRKRRIRLRIDRDAPELHLLPWESIRDTRDPRNPLDFAAMETTPFSRYIAGSWDPGAPLKQDPLKVLVVISSPKNLDNFGLTPIKANEEMKIVQEALKGRSSVDLVRMEGPATLANIEQHMKQGFAILHFVGHGKIVGEQGVVYLEKQDGTAVATPEQDFTAMIARQSWDAGRLSLVFLCSCQTASANDEHAFDGLGPGLIEAGVPAVIAMQARVRVDTAREFAKVFYRDLLQHGIIDRATNSARSSLMTSKVGGASVPVLYMRMEDGLLFDRTVPKPDPQHFLPPAPKQEPPQKSSSWFKKVVYAVGGLILFSMMLSYCGDPPAPTPLLEYSFTIQKFRNGDGVGNPHIMAADEGLTQEDLFSLSMKPLDSGHVYVWNDCAASAAPVSIALFFPYPAQSSAVSKDQNLRVPLENNKYLSFPACPGPTAMYFVFSKNPISEFDAIIGDKSKPVGDTINLSDADFDTVKKRLAAIKPLPTAPVPVEGATQLKGVDEFLHVVKLNYKK